MADEIALRRALDQLHAAGSTHGADNDGQGRANNILAGLKHRNMLDRQGVLDDMRARGHDERSLARLAKMIDPWTAFLHQSSAPRRTVPLAATHVVSGLIVLPRIRAALRRFR